jgi:hypothetical protein
MSNANWYPLVRHWLEELVRRMLDDGAPRYVVAQVLAAIAAEQERR